MTELYKRGIMRIIDMYKVESACLFCNECVQFHFKYCLNKSLSYYTDAIYLSEIKRVGQYFFYVLACFNFLIVAIDIVCHLSFAITNVNLLK